MTKSAWAIFGLIWVLLPLPTFVVAYFAIGDRWCVEQNSRFWWAFAGAVLLITLVWSGVLLVVWLRCDASWEAPEKFLLLAVFVGLIFGSISVAVINSAGDSSAASEVRVRALRFVGTSVFFAVAEGPHKGLTFGCAHSTWVKHAIAERTLLLRRGRLGLWWLDLPP